MSNKNATMNKARQNLLLAILGAILLYYAGDWAFQTMLEGPRKERLARKKQLEKRIEAREKQLSDALQAAKKLEKWEAQSLPTNTDVAVSYYRAWLTELVEFVRFENAFVDAGSPLNRRGLFYSIDFSIRATGTLDELTTFLFEFYNAGHLHQIRSINITPLPQRQTLDLAISIEALVLPSADRPDALSTEKANRLAFTSLPDYQVIAERNLFGFSKSAIHETDQTFLTAVVEVNAQPQAWFTVRSTDQVIRLLEGDQLAVGQFVGTVEQIVGHDVVVSSDGERWLLTVGESLAQALALPPEY